MHYTVVRASPGTDMAERLYPEAVQVALSRSVHFVPLVVPEGYGPTCWIVGGKDGCMRIGLYPGTFDPVTDGHVDIINRALELVDRLVIGVARNEAKRPLFSTDERVGIMRTEVAHLGARVEVQAFDGLLVNVAQSLGANVIVRGLRTGTDVEYEFPMAAMNQQLNCDIQTVFLSADPRHQPIASRLVKETARLGGAIDRFVGPGVAGPMRTKVDGW